MRFASLPASYSRWRRSMRTAWTAMALDIEGAPAVHGDDLAGDVGGAGEEVYCLRDVLGTADAPERRGSDDALALAGIELSIVRPGNRPGRHRVYAHRRCKLERERAGKRG